MRDDIVIFRGPSIPLHEAQKYSDAIMLPPAKQGDMYKAYLKYRPKAMGLIDGHFENVPSPWHKEILYLLSQGVCIYGASSMGALRASELDRFGMVGIGAVYENFANKVIEDDDEVAITHAPSQLDYIPLSVAMVDIRATLDRAVAEHVISPRLSEELLGYYKKCFYKERAYDVGINHMRHMRPEWDNALAVFKSWLHDNKVEQKKQDAIRLLQVIPSYAETKAVDFKMHNTVYWHNLKFTIDNNLPGNGESHNEDTLSDMVV